MIFITDGRPQDRGQVPAAAQSLRDKGVRIFAIGVGDATEAELKEIASTPHEDHVIFISGGRFFEAFEVSENPVYEVFRVSKNSFFEAPGVSENQFFEALEISLTQFYFS